MQDSHSRQKVPIPKESFRTLAGKTPDIEAYLRVGRDMKSDIIRFTGVGSTAHVLDIGCGSGRIARAFLDHLEIPGRYVGLDILEEPVRWCNENLSPINPAFEFFHQDIANGMYNPDGLQQASEYRFPFDDDSFDLVILASVFTHMRPEDAGNYLKEISRVLKPDGRCFCTWVLLGNDIETVKYFGIQSQEGRVGYGFHYCLNLIERCGLTLSRKPLLQRWSHDRESSFRRQDLLILEHGEAREDLVRQYPAPPEEPRRKTEVAGKIHSVNPVENVFLVVVGDRVKDFVLTNETRVRVNRAKADSSDLRPGQRVRVTFSEYSRGGDPAVLDIVARDYAEPETIAGRIVGVDFENGYLTIEDSDGFKTFAFSEDSIRVLLGDENATSDALEVNRRVLLKHVPTLTSARIRVFE